MTIKHLGGVFGRNPTFNDVTIEGTLTFEGNIDIDSDITWGDNKKAIFGDDGDLQIYHDGSDSYVQDLGSGDLRLRGTQLKLEAASGERFLEGIENGLVRIYYDNDVKLQTTSTGVDVTGTVTADGLIIDTPTSGAAATISMRDNTADSFVVKQGTNEYINVDTTNTLEVMTLGNTTTTPDVIIPGGNVGIGTSSPSALLDVKSDSGMRLTDAGGVRFLDLTPATSVGASAEIDSTSANGLRLNASGSGAEMFFDTNGAERMRIDSSGNLGIGTSSADGKLDVTTIQNTTKFTSPHLALTATSLTDNTGFTGISYASSSLTNYGWTVGALRGSSGSNASFVFTQHNDSAAGDEKMRLDSSGKLLVGKTTSLLAGSGAVLSDSGNNFTRDGASPVNLNRLTSDGALATFYKDGNSRGNIGIAFGDNLYISGDSSHSGIAFGTNEIYPSTVAGAGLDDDLNLGSSTARFKDIYATNGTIQTSDRNEKQDIEELSDAEQRVAVACKGLLRKFRWKSSVADKGDEARIHFGIIAQDLQAAFEAEGLDAGRYGMFINSTWTDEETGEERSRMGVRYNQLLAFIIAAI